VQNLLPRDTKHMYGYQGPVNPGILLDNHTYVWYLLATSSAQRQPLEAFFHPPDTGGPACGE
jgi:hypothetical protein